MATVPLFWKLTVPAAAHEVPELQSFLVPGLNPVEHLHVTLLYVGGKAPAEAAAAAGLSTEDYRLTVEALHAFSGKEVIVEVTEVLAHEEMVLARVEIPVEVPCVERKPFMTLCMGTEIRPVFAKELLKDPKHCSISKLSPPLLLQGIIELQSGINERASQPGDGTSFLGSVLSVETNPRPSRSSEPTGSATFLDEAQVPLLAKKLADSIKADSPGDPAWKLKARVQAPERPGHVYLKWAAVAGNLDAQDICEVLEARLKELA